MHELNEYRSRNGDLVGATVFLTTEAVKTIREEGSIKIEFE